jgi:hypothetical protein
VAVVVGGVTAAAVAVVALIAVAALGNADLAIVCAISNIYIYISSS